MSELTVHNSFSTGIIEAALFNQNYSDIVTYVNDRNSGTATWDAFSFLSSTNIATFNNSTGTQDIAQFKDNSTTIANIPNGGIVNLSKQDFSSYIMPISVSGPDLFNLNVTTKKLSTPNSGWVTSQTQTSLDSTIKFTCQQNGKYLVSSCLRFINSSTASTVTMLIYVNGSPVAKKVGKSAANSSPFPARANLIVDILNLLANDYIEIYVTNSAGNIFTAFDDFGAGYGGGYGGDSFCVSKLS